MGWFDKFRTGRTAAKKASAAAAEEAKLLGNQYLDQQKQFGGQILDQNQLIQDQGQRIQDYGQQIYDTTSPGMQQGQDAMSQINSFYSSPEGQQQFISQAQSNPFYNSMVSQGEQAVGRSALATGGLRGGNTGEALAQNSQNVLSGIINQRLQGLGGIADYGMQNQSNYLNASGQNMGQQQSNMGQQQFNLGQQQQNLQNQGQTLSGITGASFANANNLSNQAAGMTGLYGGLLGAGLSAAGSIMAPGAAPVAAPKPS